MSTPCVPSGRSAAQAHYVILILSRPSELTLGPLPIDLSRTSSRKASRDNEGHKLSIWATCHPPRTWRRIPELGGYKPRERDYTDGAVMRIPGFQGIIKNAIGFVDVRDIPNQRTQGIVRSDVVPIS